LSSRITTCQVYVQVVQASQYFSDLSLGTSECVCFGSCLFGPLDLFLQLTKSVWTKTSCPTFHENVWDDDDLSLVVGLWAEAILKGSEILVPSASVNTTGSNADASMPGTCTRVTKGILNERCEPNTDGECA
jgi:hypothetical protein